MVVRRMSRKNFNRLIKKQLGDCGPMLLEIPMHRAPLAFAKLPQEVDPIYLGLEWEVEQGNIYLPDFLPEVLNSSIHKYVNFREDGGGQMELVSVPATVGFLKRVFNQGLFKKNFHRDFLDSENCGIHVHVSKKAFTETTLKRFIGFIVAEENREFINEIAGRHIECCRWAGPNYVAFDYFKSGKIRRIKAFFNKRLEQTPPPDFEQVQIFPEGKYVAVNTDTGFDTIEVRIFASTLKKDVLFKNIEFVDALIRFTRAIRNAQLSVPDFCWFTAAHKDKYPHLFNFHAVQKELEQNGKTKPKADYKARA